MNATVEYIYGGGGFGNNDMAFVMGGSISGSERATLSSLICRNAGMNADNSYYLTTSGHDRGDAIIIPKYCSNTQLSSLSLTRWGGHDAIVINGDSVWATDLFINQNWDSYRS